MIHNTNSFKSAVSFVVTLGLMFAALAVLALPAFSQAATYAYVNQQGEVRTVVSNDAMSAIDTAPNRAPRSGVMLLDSTADNALVGDDVSGV